jgi:hypothetical protein
MTIETDIYLKYIKKNIYTKFNSFDAILFFQITDICPKDTRDLILVCALFSFPNMANHDDDIFIVVFLSVVTLCDSIMVVDMVSIWNAWNVFTLFEK